jgi:hypothetical protein
MNVFGWVRVGIVAVGVGSAGMAVVVADTSSLSRFSSAPPPDNGLVNQPASAMVPAVWVSPPTSTALEVLATITVANEHRGGYDRDLFGYPAAMEDRCDTRSVVLVRDSITPAQVDSTSCAIVAGDWYSAYDDATWSAPADVEIDHVVALKEAWDSGAWNWSPDRRVEFANDVDDPRMLRAVTGPVNQAKGADDPSNWIPPFEPFVCEFLADWVHIKATWSLSMDASEYGRIRNVLTDRCPGQLIDTALHGPQAAP